MKNKKDNFKTRVGKTKDLRISKTGIHGCLVYAVVGNYKGKGKQRVILHEVTLEEGLVYSYGDKRIWNFPTRK